MKINKSPGAGASAYFYENTTETSINTADVWHLVKGLTLKNACGFIYDTGSEANYTAMADSDVESGVKTKITSAAHGLSDGYYIAITGTTNYNGMYAISNVTENTFDITIAFGAEELGTWTRGTTFTARKGGQYILWWASSGISEAVAARLYDFKIFVNGVSLNDSEQRRKFGTGTDWGAMAGISCLTLLPGDQVQYGVKHIGDTDNLTIRYINVLIKKEGV